VNRDSTSRYDIYIHTLTILTTLTKPVNPPGF